MTKKSSRKKDVSATLRQTYRNQMFSEWLKANRPDIYDAILCEADKKFPSLRGPRVRRVLKEILEMK